MSYTKMVKQWERNHKNKLKTEEKYLREQRERTEQINTKIILSQIMGRIKEQVIINNDNKIKYEILISLRTQNTFTYNQYLIIWDMINYDYNQILHDLNRGKINKDDVINAIGYIDKFSATIIDDYWKDYLINPVR